MKRLCGLTVAGVMLLSGSMQAAEIDQLINALAEKGVITYGEAQQILSEGKEEARASIAKGENTTLPAWIQNMSSKGDLRLRHQSDWDSSKAYIRTRERLRLRLGFDTRIVENLKAGFGLATGSESSTTISTGTAASVIDAEPSSTNHTFSNGFSKPVVMIDYAFLEYSPLSWLKVTGGKMKAGTQVWNTTDLLWDTDINPDGLAATASYDIGPKVNVFMTGSLLTFNELSTTASNPDGYIAQPGIVIKPLSSLDVKAAVAWLQLNVNRKNTGYYGTPGNDYKCINPSVMVNVRELLGTAYTLSLFGDMVQNNDDKPKTDKNGSAYGARFGHDKITEFGQWQAACMSRSLESNAWLTKLADSDAYGGAVNCKGYEATLSFGLTSSAQLNLDYYSMDAINSATTKTPRSLLQCDLVYKF